MLLSVALKIGINPRLCAYVGNSVKDDVSAARAADMQPVLLTWVDHHEASSSPEDTIIAGDITDIVSLFEGQLRRR
jgi:FMN phosphatase YigB (HAD superfamily)